MKCESHRLSGEPFCLECGALSPAMLSPGQLALEVGEVPSQVTRDRLFADLRLWFPQMDTAEAEKRLKSGPSVLIGEIDEESGDRIVNALRAMKIPVRLLHRPRDRWRNWLWNPGWLVAPVVLGPALLLGGVTGFLLFVAAMAAPVAFAVWKKRATIPLIAAGPLSAGAERWADLSRSYAAVLEKAEPADIEALREMTREVFDIDRSLGSDSVAAIAAGGRGGSLSKRLTDAVRTAVDFTRRISEASPDEKPALRTEVARLQELVTRTNQWLGAFEDRGVKEPTHLAEELRQVTESIDRIVVEVRSPVSAAIPAREKEPS